MNRRVFERYLKEGEERQLFQTVNQFKSVLARRDYAWMRFMRQTGIRVETMAGLSVGDATAALRDRYLILRPEITKRSQGGKVFLTNKARRALRDLLQIRREMGYPESADLPLVYSRKHKRMSIRSYQDRMRHWCRAAGLEVKASPHWFRHTLAKRLMKNSTAKDPRGVVQGALNQRDPRSTAVYTLPDREDIEDAMEEVS
ncbi:tyrosine-type recombinase/integrase [Candidatus Endoriftia persephone]|jgi:site-specific recombinase XerC|uniref:Tyrosine recombinase XerC n=3 Tax=Gammaproteobacteria TaxID=1236 RepID=G2FD62_9GAMM|nr:tyrosine-type recombinase/integrase [Candidatus Endoriftia persephone]EGV50025.1 site-specific recombinase XerC [endosymbiont of Riftia pachyptila (vent Ph05)]EGW55148.1 tyrosine recombinase XerC [endosymbiont of Tevnia jerichonana (vent Tica)]USF88769.1 site-specific integrase [Candidatus Endoriftia persephone]